MRWLCALGLLSACTPARCQVVTVDVHELAGKPKPAGLVVVGCDGRKLVVIEAEKVGR